MSTGIETTGGLLTDSFLSAQMQKNVYKIFDIDKFDYDLDYMSKNSFLYVRLKPSQIISVNMLHDIGFYVVNQEVELKSHYVEFASCNNEDIEFVKVHYPIELKDGDFAEFEKIFRNSRLYIDTNTMMYYPKILKTWIQNIFSKTRGDELHIAYDKENGRLVGFIGGYKDGDFKVIDLIAVIEQYQSQNIASALISNFGYCSNVKVSTQLTNTKALNLYSKMKFKVSQIYTVMHRFNH